jgi:alpha-L-fucosidase
MPNHCKCALSAILLVLFATGVPPASFAQTFEASWESLGQYQCPEWFRDAKLGIFLHWGPTSVAAVDGWYGRNMYIQGHRAYEYHVKTFGHPSKFGYKDIIALWKAENFDPDHLVQLFKQAGARYVVPVAVHHDNFDLWDSTYQRWNAVKIGPKKDIIGLWKKAILTSGLRFGVSTHMDRSLSWFNTSKGSDKTGPLAGVPYDGADPQYSDLYCEKNDEGMEWPYLPKNAPESWRKTWFIRTKDLVDKYHPDLLYFDGGIPYVDVGLPLVAHFYNENQKWHNGRLEAVLNLKKTKVSGAYREGMCVQDLERGKLEGIKPEPWQTDTSINGPWFYEQGGRYETPNAIIDMFADIVSKNGNLLLNIPLRADGTLDSESERILLEMGKWMAINGEAIHGTRPWLTYGEGPTSVRTEYSEEIKEAYTTRDFRFTTKGDALYVIGLEWPDGGHTITVRSLSTGQKLDKIVDLCLLGYAGSLRWKRDGEGLKISLPEKKPCDYAYVIRITFKK